MCSDGLADSSAGDRFARFSFILFPESSECVYNDEFMKGR